jgi:hypothetical protein
MKEKGSMELHKPSDAVKYETEEGKRMIEPFK